MLGTLVFLAVIVGASGTFPPAMAVLSGSMEAWAYRGSFLAIHSWTEPAVGQVIVFHVKGRETPIVHRVVEYVEPDCVLTKGDNNPVDDHFLYEPDQKCVPLAQILGIVWLNVPYLGWPAILTSDAPGKVVAAIIFAFFSRSDIRTVYSLLQKRQFKNALAYFLSL
jgi:signal peptidase